MTATVGIDRTVEQRARSLERANQIRFARARMKRQLRVGLVDETALLVDPPLFLRSMKVSRFLVAIPTIGDVKARLLMRQVGISEGKTVGGLSDRQRTELVILLRQRRHGG